MGHVPPPEVLARFWELSGDLLAVADLGGRYVYLNPRWEELTGFDVAELMAKPYVDFVHPEDRERTVREAEEMAERGRESTGFENRYLTAEGSTLWLRWNGVAALEEGWVYAVATDITELRISEQQLALMGAVSEAANRSSFPSEAFDAALRLVGEATDWSVGHVYLLADGGVLASSECWWVREPERFRAFQELSDSTTFIVGEGLPGRVVHGRQTVWVRDALAEPGFQRGLPDAESVRAAVGVPIRSGDEVIGVLELFSDVPRERDNRTVEVLEHVGTQLGRVYDRAAVDRLRRKAVESERRFLSMATHEMRTPLVGIDSYAMLLSSDWDSFTEEERKEFVGRIGESAVRLRRLIDSLLDLGKKAAERFEPRLEEFDLSGLVSRAVHDLSPSDPGVELVVPGEVLVVSDSDFWIQIVINLVANAVRHGAPPIDVRLSCTEAEVVFEVRDQGPGVPQDFVPELFKRFARADRDSEGAGLGLSIVRDLATAMGGDVGYRSADPGACFWVTIPRCAKPVA